MFNAPTYEVLSQFLFASRLMSVDKTAGNTEQITIDQVLNKLGSVKLQSLVVAREGTDFLAQNGSWVFCRNTASGQQLMVDLSTAEASKIGGVPGIRRSDDRRRLHPQLSVHVQPQ